MPKVEIEIQATFVVDVPERYAATLTLQKLIELARGSLEEENWIFLSQNPLEKDLAHIELDWAQTVTRNVQFIDEGFKAAEAKSCP